MEREKKLVSLCLLILFMSLVLVYALLYQVKWAEILAQLPPKQNLEKLPSETEQKEEKNQVFTLDFTTGSQDQNLWVSNSNMPTLDSDAETGVKESDQTASTESFLELQDTKVQMLSGAELYFWVLESIELLGLNPEYLLRDQKGIYYAFFAKEPLELKKAVQQLNGNLHSIVSDADKLKHQLFGDKISYINLSEYKDKLVLMLIEVKWKFRFLQIPYAEYHKSKSYLKSLFIY